MWYAIQSLPVKHTSVSSYYIQGKSIYYWQGDDHGAMELQWPCATGPTLTSGEETLVGAWDVIPSRWLVYEHLTLA